MTPNREINGVFTLHAAFPPLSRAPLTGYSTSDKYGLQKPDILPKRYGNQTANLPYLQLIDFTKKI